MDNQRLFKITGRLTSIVKGLFAKGSFLRSRLALMVLCYTVLMSIITTLRHYFLFSGAWDLGIFNQVFWSTLHGRFFYYSVEPWFGQSFFGVHFSPILSLVIPFYAVYPHPETLLVLQSFIIALGAVPLYFLAKDELNERLALLLSLLYLTHPLLLGANLFDFHFEAFIPVTLLSTIYFLKKRNMKFYTLSLFLSLISHEYVAFLAILIVLYELITKIKAKDELRKIAPYAVLTILASVVWVFLASAIHSYLKPPETQSMNVLAPVLNEIGRPLQLLSYLDNDLYTKFSYLTLLLAPLLFTSLFSSYLLLTLPWLLFAFTLNYSPYYNIGYQYSLVTIPFAFLSSIYGIKKLLRSNSLMQQTFSKLLLFSALFFLISTATLMQPQAIEIKRIESTRSIISLIPQNASVLTTNNFFPHVSNRFDAWVLPFSYDEPYPLYYTGISEVWKDYSHKILNETHPDFVLLDLREGETQNMRLIISELLAKRNYEVYAYAGDILLLKKNYEGTPQIFVPLNATFNYKNLILYDGTIVRDLTSTSSKVLAHTTQDLNNVSFWGGPHHVMPPGKYEVTFVLKLIGNAQNGNVVTVNVATEKGTEILNSTVIHLGDFKELETWEEFTLTFQITEVPAGIEFRGLHINNAVDLYLDFIEVVQLDYKPS
jgi:uncharacterized membrane protein